MNETKRPDLLKVNSFSFKLLKDRRVMIYWKNRLLKILIGKGAERFLRSIQGKEDSEIQLALAKLTGNFKRGNEKQPLPS